MTTDEFVADVFACLINGFAGKRQRTIDRGREIIKNGHTYWHGVARMFDAKGMIGEMERVWGVAGDAIKRY